MENEKWKEKARTAIYSMAGFYLIYLAYKMFHTITGTSGNEQILMVVFTVLFAVIGLALVLGGIIAGYKMTKREQENSDLPENIEQTEEVKKEE